MDTEDGRIIARLQRLTAELLADKRVGRWRAETVDEIYRTRQELERRGLNSCRQHRDAILRADQQAWRSHRVDQDRYAHSSYALGDVARPAGLRGGCLVASGSNSTAPVLLADSFRKNAMDCRVKAESAPSDLTRKYWLDMAAQWVRLAEDTDKRVRRT